MDRLRKKHCCICRQVIVGSSHNPKPVSRYGRCCAQCFWRSVHPARIASLHELARQIDRELQTAK